MTSYLCTFLFPDFVEYNLVLKIESSTLPNADKYKELMMDHFELYSLEVGLLGLTEQDLFDQIPRITVPTTAPNIILKKLLQKDVLFSIHAKNKSLYQSLT